MLSQLKYAEVLKFDNYDQIIMSIRSGGKEAAKGPAYLLSGD